MKVNVLSKTQISAFIDKDFMINYLNDFLSNYFFFFSWQMFYPK